MTGCLRDLDLLIEDPEVLVCLAVSLVVVYGAVQPDGFEGGLLPPCHDIPAEPSASEMIQCREPLGQKERRLKRRRCCDPKGQVFGHSCHRGDGLCSSG